MLIRRYTRADSDSLFALIEREGDEWTYWQGENRIKYEKALDNCIVYLIFESDVLCGYARCRDDFGFGIYVLDLLVDKEYRGKEYGRLLMEQACRDFPDCIVYVTGDVYPYYEKLGYKEEGKIYIVKRY
ncbi:MAG: GNAT family N-acetyltransferase [Defluviitaleaceae bacterium]|nr:GNAT family N-acetyltransferase [Defluviitaleaceae bacterium]